MRESRKLQLPSRNLQISRRNLPIHTKKENDPVSTQALNQSSGDITASSICFFGAKKNRHVLPVAISREFFNPSNQTIEIEQKRKKTYMDFEGCNLNTRGRIPPRHWHLFAPTTAIGRGKEWEINKEKQRKKALFSFLI
jgi:hypothetical protein